MKLLLLALALAGAVAGPACAGTGPQVAHFTLWNGLEVVVVPDHRAPVVTHMIWYKVGAADETAGKSGLAHFLEHLMFKGTTKNPGDTFSQRVAAIGGQENAFTSSDYTGFFQRVPREHLKEMMAFEADRITGLVLTDAVVRARAQCRARRAEYPRRQQSERPARRADGRRALPQSSLWPAARSAGGTEIETLTRDDALAFYRRFYTPNNAIVVIAGDVTPEEVKADAEETYGKIAPRAEIAPRRRPHRAGAGGAAHGDARRPAGRATEHQPHLSRALEHDGKAWRERGARSAAHMLGAGANSRLYRALVVDQGIALNAGAYYSGMALDYAKFGVYGSPKPGKTLHEVEAAIDAVLAEISEHGVTADELESAKSRLLADAVYAQDNQATLARWYGSALATGLTVETVQAWPAAIRAVTGDAVREAARTWLDRRASVTGYLVNSLKAEEKHS